MTFSVLFKNMRYYQVTWYCCGE